MIDDFDEWEFIPLDCDGDLDISSGCEASPLLAILARMEICRSVGGISEAQRQFFGARVPWDWWFDEETYYWLPPGFCFGSGSVQ